MRITGESITHTGIAIAFVLGTVACSEDEKTEIDRTKEIPRLASELQAAKKILSTGQAEYMAYIDSLPEDCEQAIRPYIQPDGRLVGETDVSDAVKVTAPWCGPAHLDAIPTLNVMFRDLESIQSEVNHLDYSLAANLAAVGVTVPPTLG